MSAGPRWITAAEAETEIVIDKASVTLTDAQTKVLPAAAIEMVAASGASQIIFPFSATIFCDTTGGAYTNLTEGATFGFRLGPNKISALEPEPCANLLTSGDPEAWLIDPITQRENKAQALADDFTNQPLMFFLESANLTGGDPSNSLKVTVYYSIVAI